MEKIDRYEILEPLMETGFSDIYIAQDPASDLKVAIKVFHPKGDNIGEKAQYGIDFWRDRFEEEARILGKFDHPNIISVLDSGKTEEGEPYFVMPFISANLLIEIGEDETKSKKIEDIAEKWKPRAISARRAVTIWRQVLSALAALHAENLVHRDIKPQNILLTAWTDGVPKLCDFGMVKVPGGKGSRSGIWIGTLEYISPEQQRSATDVDQRSDVYSSGALMYRMLTGKVSPHVRSPLRPRRYRIPDELGTLIDDCMQTRRSDRPKDAGEVLRRLDEAVPDVNILPANAIRVLRRKI